MHKKEMDALNAVVETIARTLQALEARSTLLEVVVLALIETHPDKQQLSAALAMEQPAKESATVALAKRMQKLLSASDPTA